MKLCPRSVRVRLTLWYAGALGVILLVFAAGVYTHAYRSLNAQIQAQFVRDLDSIERLLCEDPGELEELDEHGVVALFQVERDGEPLFETAAWNRLGFDVVLSQMVEGQDQVHAAIADRRYRVQTRAVAGGGRRLRIAAALDEEAAQHALADLAEILLIATPLALLLACFGGYVLAGRLLAPVGALARKAGELTAERLSERLPVEDPHDEFGRLAQVFNHTLARLENSFQRLRQFTADASHELRTPLTVLRSVGEVALRDGRDGAACREAIGSILEEVDRMTRLVESLLVLTRADAGQAALKPEILDLAELARHAVEYVRVLAEEKSQVITLDLAEDTSTLADRDALRRAIVNLLDNAIKYSPPGSPIRVRAGRMEDGAVEISVQDQGPGIPADEQPKVFDRFYRLDRSRSREAGGVGLGLSIARWAVEASGGRIDLCSEAGCGSTFRMVLPAVIAR